MNRLQRRIVVFGAVVIEARSVVLSAGVLECAAVRLTAGCSLAEWLVGVLRLHRSTRVCQRDRRA